MLPLGRIIASPREYGIGNADGMTSSRRNDAGAAV
jgi:hypothetical protein